MSQGSRVEREYAKAKQCGMTVYEWQAARNQIKADRSRGKGTGAGKKAPDRLADWGPVDGQVELFDVETTGGDQR